MTTYNYAGNKPITGKDLEGLQNTTDESIKEQVGQKIDQIKSEAQEYKKEKEKQLEKFTRDKMISYAEKLYPKVRKLSEAEKQEVFKTNTNATIAILLFEFLTGSGPSDGSREFSAQHQIVRDLAKMDITKNAIDAFYEKNEGKSIGELEGEVYRYRMSPNSDIYQGFNLDNFIIEHSKIVKEELNGENPLRVFLGSMTYFLEPNNGNIDISIVDGKSRYSLFFHATGLSDIAKNVRRKAGKNNPPFSSTNQQYSFSISLNPKRLKTFTQKVKDKFNNIMDYYRKN